MSQLRKTIERIHRRWKPVRWGGRTWLAVGRWWRLIVLLSVYCLVFFYCSITAFYWFEILLLVFTVSNFFYCRLSFFQIKEKLGSLRWHGNIVTQEMRHILSFYESLSECLCIRCGKVATRVTTEWISPYCDDDCPVEQESVPIRQYHDGGKIDEILEMARQRGIKIRDNWYWGTILWTVESV